MLSKEEVEAEKATMRAIDARPIKKVAEAKQRKRKRLQVRLPLLLPQSWPSMLTGSYPKSSRLSAVMQCHTLQHHKVYPTNCKQSFNACFTAATTSILC